MASCSGTFHWKIPANFLLLYLWFCFQSSQDQTKYRGSTKECKPTPDLVIGHRTGWRPCWPPRGLSDSASLFDLVMAEGAWEAAASWHFELSAGFLQQGFDFWRYAFHTFSSLAFPWRIIGHPANYCLAPPYPSVLSRPKSIWYCCHSTSRASFVFSRSRRTRACRAFPWSVLRYRLWFPARHRAESSSNHRSSPPAPDC